MRAPERALLGVVFWACAQVGAVAAQSGATQQAPFKTGVELILIDATVLDKTGRPVPDLLASDFTIAAGGKTRRIVSAQYVHSDATGARATGRATVAAEISGTVTVSGRAAGERSILIAVDVAEIRAGEGRGAMAKIGEYLDGLPPTDRVGLVSLPWGTPRVELSADRGAIRAALERIAGASTAIHACEPTAGESAAISVGDARGYETFRARAESLGCRPVIELRTITPFLNLHRRHTKEVLQSLKALAEAMGPLPGRKAIVFVSEGLFSDEETRRDLDAFGTALEQSRVVLYAMHLDFPFAEAMAPRAGMQTRRLDDRYGFDAMVELAVAGGGTAFRVTGLATPVIARIDMELSGYYLLAFERENSDTANRRLKIQVKVNRPAVEVRSRQAVLIGKTP